jgi:peptidoglycan/xylan/chitin deacetylase (PgdA/CDA1 family)
MSVVRRLRAAGLVACAIVAGAVPAPALAEHQAFGGIDGRRSVTAATATTTSAAALMAATVTTSATAAAAASPAPAARPAAGRYLAARCGNTSGRVLLTFDDWSYQRPIRMVELAEALRARGVGAMFFPLSQYAAAYRRTAHVDVVALTRARGMYVGNHTYSHRELSRLGPAAVSWQISHGVPSTVLRPPYGSANASVRAVAARLGYRLCLRTVGTTDWAGRSPAAICATVRNQARPGGVVLMHLQTRSWAAVDCIIKGLRSRGLSLCRPAPAPTPARIPNPLYC